MHSKIIHASKIQKATNNVLFFLVSTNNVQMVAAMFDHPANAPMTSFNYP